MPLYRTPTRYVPADTEETMGLCATTVEFLTDNCPKDLAPRHLIDEQGIGGALRTRVRHLLPEPGDAWYNARIEVGWTLEEIQQIRGLITEAMVEVARATGDEPHDVTETGVRLGTGVRLLQQWT